MTDHAAPPTCPDCGAALPGNSPQNLCPSCLMRQALASRTIVDGNAGAASPPPPSPEEIADKFPQFEITECLGRGGMGVVYKALQKSLNRTVAIKILAPERVGNEKFAERFTREARTLARLNHPNIVTVFDHGETDGLFYIVMEFVDGVNLRDLLRDGRLAPKQALSIVPPVCEALQYAHDKGVVHRDIKPENLLLDREGRIKIADFGIAAMIGASSETSGTPPYMAPEQADAARDVDHRADIYALGVVLYEMLTGERPRIPMPRPSGNAATNDGIDAMVRRAMSPDPEERFQTAEELRTVAEQVADETTAPRGRSASTTTVSRPPVVRKSAFRRWWWVMLVMLPIGPVLGLLVGALTIYFLPKKYESTAVVQVMPTTPDLDPFGKRMSGGMNPGSMTRQFFATEFEVIIAEATLEPVSRQLDLPMRWNVTDHTAINILKGIISTKQIRGTDLIEIRVRHTNPDDAANIANLVAQSYQERRAELEGKRMEKISPQSPLDRIPKMPITIHERAKRAHRPASPKVVHSLTISAAAGLLLAPLLGLLLMPILQKLFPQRK